MQQIENSLRILLVEDDPEITKIVADRLSSIASAIVDTASSGVEAYNKCVEMLSKQTPYLAVISDLNLPRFSGIDLLTKLRKNDFLSKTPVMFISGRFDAESLSQMAKFKVKHLLIKPFKLEDFDRRVGDLLKSATAAL